MTTKHQSIAIIGSGITGLSASWLLHKKYKVTLFEKNSHIGGHTHTHDVPEDDKMLSIDSGFIVYNEKNYPNLVGLFNQLDVETQATDMSFAFSLDKGKLEYSGTDLKGMFAQRRNLFSLKHWRLIAEIVRFNKVAHAALADINKNNPTTLLFNHGVPLTLAAFLAQHKFSHDLQQHYLLPMGAAIWSCPMEVMNSFPAYSFLRFFSNHGLIDLHNRPQWRSVVGGSREYVKKIMAEADLEIKGAAKSVVRHKHAVDVLVEEECLRFDQVIFACHADEALALLETASPDEQDILGCFNYQENQTYLHTDVSLMPQRKKAWCSWNYLASSEKGQGATKKVTATYWMNSLQTLQSDQQYLVTLNPFYQIDPSKVIKEMTYHHPVFDHDALHAQTRLKEIQGKNNSWFCGSYSGYGFHEDALSSSLAVCEQLGVIAPWNNKSGVPEETARRSQ